MSLTEKISDLASRIESKKSERARAEAKLEAAERAHSEALQGLNENFSVGSLEEAQKLLKKLRKRSEKLLIAAEEALGE